MKNIIFLALLFIPAISFGDKWYLLNAKDGQCLKADMFATLNNAPAFQSPLELIAFAQDHNMFDGLRVMNLKGGALYVQVNFNHGDINYFDTEYSCEIGSKVLAKIQSK